MAILWYFYIILKFNYLEDDHYDKILDFIEDWLKVHSNDLQYKQNRKPQKLESINDEVYILMQILSLFIEKEVDS